MALDDFEQDDPYRQRVNEGLNGPVGSGGIAGPNDGGFPAPVASPQGGYDLEAIRGKLGFGKVDFSKTGGVQGWLDANRNIASGVTVRNDKLYDPTGKYMSDAVSNMKTGGTMSQFLDGIGSNGKPRTAAPPQTGVTRTTGPGLQTASGSAAAPVAPAANNFLTQIRQLITERLGKMSADPSMDDPALAAQSAAYKRSRERGAQGERAAMAERAAMNGTLQGGQSSGSFDTDLRSIYENAGEDIASNDARLLGTEVQQRRNEVQSLMNMALQSGDAESARALQMQLAKMDEALRRQAMANQNSQYYAGLNQQGRQWDDQFGRDLGRDYESDYRFRVGLGLGGV